jgi:hypothetical protein
MECTLTTESFHRKLSELGTLLTQPSVQRCDIEHTPQAQQCIYIWECRVGA